MNTHRGSGAGVRPLESRGRRHYPLGFRDNSVTSIDGHPVGRIGPPNFHGVIEPPDSILNRSDHTSLSSWGWTSDTSASTRLPQGTSSSYDGPGSDLGMTPDRDRIERQTRFDTAVPEFHMPQSYETTFNSRTGTAMGSQFPRMNDPSDSRRAHIQSGSGLLYIGSEEATSPPRVRRSVSPWHPPLSDSHDVTDRNAMDHRRRRIHGSEYNSTYGYEPDLGATGALNADRSRTGNLFPVPVRQERPTQFRHFDSGYYTGTEGSSSTSGRHLEPNVHLSAQWPTVHARQSGASMGQYNPPSSSNLIDRGRRMPLQNAPFSPTIHPMSIMSFEAQSANNSISHHRESFNTEVINSETSSTPSQNSVRYRVLADKSVECLSCGKVFKAKNLSDAKSNVNRHFSTKHEGRDYECSESGCSLKFNRSDNQRRHSQRCRGDRG